jgi:hypothetical protein
MRAQGYFTPFGLVVCIFLGRQGLRRRQAEALVQATSANAYGCAVQAAQQSYARQRFTSQQYEAQRRSRRPMQERAFKEFRGIPSTHNGDPAERPGGLSGSAIDATGCACAMPGPGQLPGPLCHRAGYLPHASDERPRKKCGISFFHRGCASCTPANPPASRNKKGPCPSKESLLAAYNF